MKLATIETSTGPRAVGVAEDGRFVDLAGIDESLPACTKGVLALEDGLAKAAAALAKGVASETFVEGTLLAPIPVPGKVVCIGLNYRDHAAESNSPIPEEPVVFNKFSSCVVGPEATVMLPAAAKRVDYEAELVVVIGRTASRVKRDDALAHVAGYTCGNDVSARDWQKGRPQGQWLLGKAPDTFAPLGPWIVTADEIPDPQNLSIGLRLNGEQMQDGRTNELIFGVGELIEHISQLCTLLPGDVIYTGTPPGVGMARRPPVLLKSGDRMEVEIEGIGVLANDVESE